jgi:hypothetical protein
VERTVMATQIVEIAAHRCVLLDAEGPAVRDASGGRDLIEEAMNNAASVIAVPVTRLDASFFQLRSGLAGEVLQKAANYGFKFAVIGDISEYVAASDALRDFVRECNRGNSIFFEPDIDSLRERISRADNTPATR